MATGETHLPTSGPGREPPTEALAPPASTAIKPAPGSTADVPDVHLPPPPKPAPFDAAAAARSLFRLDAILVALVLLLAFLLASFPARNSDIWTHLATGRALLAGQYSFGSDPFLHTTAGLTWVNHSWLYDLLCYGIYQVLGGPGLVVVKALLVVLLAEILLRLGRSASGLWLSAIGTGLAVLALGPFLQLQPVIVSYLFLGLTLWFLERQRRRLEEADTPGAAKAVGFASYWPLLVLFVLWVNMDSWFLLGPLTVGLYWAGQTVERLWGAPAPGVRHTRPLGLVALAGLAVCLVNPHHVHAFALPPLLAPFDAASVLRPEAYFGEPLVSPLSQAYLTSRLALTPAFASYVLLAALGAVSFAVTFGRWRGWRVAVWLAFLLLSTYQLRAVPFFAIVGAPILALNFHDAAARRAGAAQRGGAREAFRRARASRRALIAAGVLLVAAAWPGWVQGELLPLQRWDVVPDPAAVHAAAQLERWRQEGSLAADARGINLSPAAGDYFAWGCTREKSFLDGRLPGFTEVARDYVAVREGLRDESARRASGKPTGREGDAWRNVLRARKVSYVTVHAPLLPRALPLLQYFLAGSEEWPLLFLDGRVAIFAWRDGRAPAGQAAFARLGLNSERLALWPADDKKAPPRGPERDPQPHAWWDVLHPPRPRALATDEAGMYLLAFDADTRAYQQVRERAWKVSLRAALAGLAPDWGGLSGAAVPVARAVVAGTVLHPPLPPEQKPATRLDYIADHLRKGYLVGERSPALPLLAVRAARRALQQNPDDPATYLFLKEAYLRLVRDTCEWSWKDPQRLPQLENLRTVQIVTALHNVLRLRPAPRQAAQAHQFLLDFYRARGLHDLALEHLRGLLDSLVAAGPQPGESAADFRRQLAPLRETLAQAEKFIKRSLKDVEAQTATLKVVERAEAALARGLGRKALDILLASDISFFGKKGLQLEVDLLLLAGRVRDVQDWVEPQHAETLGMSGYHLLHAQAALARGDYVRADGELEKGLEASDLFRSAGGKASPLRAELARVFGGAVLNAAVPLHDKPVVWSCQVLREQVNLKLLFRELDEDLDQRAKTMLLRGLLALESGETDRAVGHLEAALAVWRRVRVPQGAGPDSGARGVARQALELIHKAR